MGECLPLQRESAFPNGSLQSADALLDLDAGYGAGNSFPSAGSAAGSIALGVGPVVGNVFLVAGFVSEWVVRCYL